MPAVAALQQDSAASFGGVDAGQNLLYIYFSVAAAGLYVGNGDVLDLTALGDVLKSSRPPLQVTLQGNAGYFYSYKKAAVPTQANGKFQVSQCAGAGAPAADIGAGAYPAGVLADVITGCAIFPRV